MLNAWVFIRHTFRKHGLALTKAVHRACTLYVPEQLAINSTRLVANGLSVALMLTSNTSDHMSSCKLTLNIRLFARQELDNGQASLF